MKDPKWAAIRLAGAYVIIAAVWIVASDWIIALFPGIVAQSLQTVKGLAFVVFTGAVLFLLVQRMHDRLRLESRQAHSMEVLFEQVIDTVPVGVVFINEDGVITFLNSAAEDLLSMPMAESVGRRIEELWWGGSPETAAHISRLLETGSVDGLRLGRPDDPVPRAVIARAAAVDPEARMSGWVIAIADVTRTHQEGERAQRLMASYRFLAESVVLCGRASDPATLVAQVAELAVERGGYRAAWAIAKHEAGEGFEEVARVGLGDAASDAMAQLRTQAESEHSIASEALLDGEVTVSNDIARDPANPWHAAAGPEGLGSSAVFGISGVAGIRASITLFSAEPGHFDAEEVGLLAQLQGALSFAFEKIGLDRHRLEAEEALECSERAYRELFVSHPAPLWVYDVETLEFLAVNEAARRKYGYSAQEFASMTIADIRPSGEIPRLLENVASLNPGFEDAGIWTHTDRSGRDFPVHVYSHPIDWDGREAELVLVQEIACIG